MRGSTRGHRQRPGAGGLEGGTAVPNSAGTFLNFCDFRWQVHGVPLGTPPELAPLPPGGRGPLGQKPTAFGIGIAPILARIWSHTSSHFGSVFDRFRLRVGSKSGRRLHPFRVPFGSNLDPNWVGFCSAIESISTRNGIAMALSMKSILPPPC